MVTLPDQLAPNSPLDDLSRERLPYIVTFSLIAAVVLSLAATAFVVEKSRHQERATVAASNMAQLFSQNVVDTFKTIDAVLRAASLFYQHLGTENGIHSAVLDTHLTQLQSTLPEIDGLRIVDERGVVKYGADVPTTEPLNLSDREFFVRATHEKDPGLMINGPLFAKIANKWVIVFSRRLDNPNGSFAGVIYAVMGSDRFERLLSSVTIGRYGAATLRTEALALVHRAPAVSNSVGSKQVSQQLIDAIARQPERGAYIAPTALDGYPFYVIVGLSTQDYVANAYQNILIIACLSSLTLLVSFVAVRRAYRARLLLLQDLAEMTRLGNELQQLNTTLEEKVQERTAELRVANALLQELARHDILTGLGNRLFADECLNEEFLRTNRSGDLYSVLIIDIDHFKRVNDTFGHAVGDQVLQQFARMLPTSVRATDHTARFGGEEFLVVLPNTHIDNAIIVAEKIRQVAATAEWPTGQVITVSIGVAAASMEDESKETVVKRADSALYQAKKNGRNQVCVNYVGTNG